VLLFNPLNNFFSVAPPFQYAWAPLLYLIQWMAIGWGALFLRFAYVALQEEVRRMVHG
jgi:hypothetical protein